MRSIILFTISVFLVSCVNGPLISKASTDSKQKRLKVIQAHLLLGQVSLAKKHLDLIEENDKERNYWRLLSLYWMTVEDFQKALIVHELALMNFPNDGFILNNYGVLLAIRGRWNEACLVFNKAVKRLVPIRQSVLINVARCALSKKDVNLAGDYLKEAKEIADLPLIGLMTELNLALIRGSTDEARLIFNNIQTSNKVTRGTVHFDEYQCLSLQLDARETTTSSLYLSTNNFTCLNVPRYEHDN